MQFALASAARACRYTSEHPWPVTERDLDRCCALCGAMLGAVTVYRVSETWV